MWYVPTGQFAQNYGHILVLSFCNSQLLMTNKATREYVFCPIRCILLLLVAIMSTGAPPYILLLLVAIMSTGPPPYILLLLVAIMSTGAPPYILITYLD